MTRWRVVCEQLDPVVWDGQTAGRFDTLDEARAEVRTVEQDFVSFGVECRGPHHIEEVAE